MKRKVFTWICLAGAALALTGCGKKTEIALIEYADVVFAGVNGDGTAQAEIDQSDLALAVASDLAEGKQDRKPKEVLKELGDFAGFSNSVSCSLDKTEGLSNGDEVTVAVTWNREKADECGLKMIGEEKKTVTVEGLKERVEIDPFDSRYFGTKDGIFVDFFGYSPFGWVSIENNVPENNPLSRVFYRADREEGISRGDTVVITANFPEEYEQEGYVLTGTEKEVTAEYMKSFVKEWKPEFWDSLKPYCEQEITEQLENVFYIAQGEEMSRFTKHDVVQYEGITCGPEAFLATSKTKENTEEYKLLIVPYEIRAQLTGGMYLGENAKAAGYFVIRNLLEAEDGTLETDKITVQVPECFYTSLEQADQECLAELRQTHEFISISLEE